MRIARVVFGVLLVASVPTAAQAADELGLSADGVSWGPTLDGPLFDPDFRWIPGDQKFTSFWLRNQSATPALLDIDVMGTDTDALLRTGDLEVAVRVGDGPWVTTRQSGRQSLAAAVPVDTGQERQVTVSVQLDAAATNTSQVQRWDLRFEARLTEDTSVLGDEQDTDPSDDDDDDESASGREGSGWLPGTGGQAWWLLPAGAGLVGLGAALVKRRRAERFDV